MSLNSSVRFSKVRVSLNCFLAEVGTPIDPFWDRFWSVSALKTAKKVQKISARFARQILEKKRGLLMFLPNLGLLKKGSLS